MFFFLSGVVDLVEGRRPQRTRPGASHVVFLATLLAVGLTQATLQEEPAVDATPFLALRLLTAVYGLLLVLHAAQAFLPDHQLLHLLRGASLLLAGTLGLHASILARYSPSALLKATPLLVSQVLWHVYAACLLLLVAAVPPGRP